MVIINEVASRHQMMSDGHGGEGMIRTKADREPPPPLHPYPCPPPTATTFAIVTFKFLVSTSDKQTIPGHNAWAVFSLWRDSLKDFDASTKKTVFNITFN